MIAGHRIRGKALGIMLFFIIVGLMFSVWPERFLGILKSIPRYYKTISIVYGAIVIGLCIGYYSVFKKYPAGLPDERPFFYFLGPLANLIIDGVANIFTFYSVFAVLNLLAKGIFGNTLPTFETVILILTFIVLIFFCIKHTAKRAIKTIFEKTSVEISGGKEKL